jgi:hypothetical protein
MEEIATAVWVSEKGGGKQELPGQQNGEEDRNSCQDNSHSCQDIRAGRRTTTDTGRTNLEKR